MSDIVWTFSDKESFKAAILREYRNIFNYDDINFSENSKDKYNKYHLYMSNVEKTQTEEAIKNNKTRLEENSVKYFVNELGCRGNWNINNENKNKLRIAFFGCSFCFGVGIDEDKIFQSIIRDNWKKYDNVEIINLGYPGGNISKCAKLFKYLTNVYSIDIAIFLLPTHLRDEFLVRDPNNLIHYSNMIPNYSNKSGDEKWKIFYELMDDDNLLYKATMAIEIIESISTYKNINTYYTSWDFKTYTHIKDIIIDHKKILPYYKFLENMLPDENHKGRARDGNHPGPSSHEKFAEEIIEHLTNFYPYRYNV